jgi:amidase
MAPSKDWQAIVAEKRKDAFARIPKSWRLPNSTFELYNSSTPVNILNIPRDCGILSNQELVITEQYDAIALAEKLATRSLTATAVTTAFSKRAAIAQQLVQQTILSSKNSQTDYSSDKLLDRDFL